VFNIKNKVKDAVGKARNVMQYAKITIKALKAIYYIRGIKLIPSLKIDLIIAINRDDATAREKNSLNSFFKQLIKLL
jgi:hypothetical protein